MPELVALRDLTAHDAATAGAKAANLGALIAAGVPVPDGFCVPAAVHDALVRPVLAPILERLGPDVSETGARSLRKAVESVRLPEGLLAELAARLHAVRPPGGSVAVRSSGTSEDTSATSFAGQYRTELGVRSFDDLVAAVRRCWSSMWEWHAVRYRERQGLAHSAASMAVLVQAVVAADASGVLFTADPTGQRVLIESSWGFGEAVAGGLVTPDRFRVSRPDAQVQEVELACKERMVVTAAGGGTSVVDVPAGQREAASLTRAQAVELARLGLRIEQHFGSAQDVEWAIAQGRPAILQSRPLTHPEPPAARWESPIDGAWWARISICDSWLPEPLSPLFATTLFPRLVQRWLENWAGPEHEQRDNPLLPKPMAGTINGFGYLRLDYPMNRYPLRTVRLALRCYRYHLGFLRKRWRTAVLPRHVDRLAALRELDPALLDTPALLASIDEAQDLSARYWAILGGLAWYWNGGEWLLDRAYPHLTAPAARAGAEVPGYGVLLQGYPTKTSEAESALREVARAGEAVSAARFDDVLAEYGHQVFQLDFVEPTPAEDPSTLHAMVDAHREGRLQAPQDRLRELAKRRRRAEAALFAGLRGAPLRRAALRGLLRWNRRYAKVRDHALFYFTLGWPVIRRAYLELGRRLVASGALGAAADVFYLTADELHAQLGAEEPAQYHEVVRERLALREQQRTLSPRPQVPESVRIFMGGLDVTAVALLGQQGKPPRGASIGGASIIGSPVSPGRVTARARHISSARGFDEFAAGEVLVASFITPAWSPLLAIAGGVVTDTGGVLSHGSIVAREYGIPTVMGTNNATKAIRDGQVVTVDGDRGLVY